MESKTSKKKDTKYKAPACVDSARKRPSKPKKKPIIKTEPTIKVEAVLLENKQKLDNIKALALLMKEIFEVAPGHKRIISRKEAKVEAQLEYCDKYIKALNSANCKVALHNKLFYALFDKYRVKMLNSYEQPDWMNKEKETINVQLGVGTEFAKQNMTLKLSMALNSALKMKREIDDAEYDNINDYEEAKSKYRYQYLDIFHYRLLTIIADSVEDTMYEQDKTRLIEEAAKFRELTHLHVDDSSTEEEGGAMDAMADLLNSATGGNGGLGGKELVGMFKTVTSNTGVVDRMGGIFKKLEGAGKDGMNKDMFKIIGDEIGDMIGDTVNTLDNKKTQKPTSESDKASETSKDTNVPKDVKVSNESSTVPVTETASSSSESAVEEALESSEEASESSVEESSE